MSIADALFEAAKRAFVADDLASAEKHCKTLVALAPADARPWVILTDIALVRAQADEALRSSEMAVSLDRRDPFTFLAKTKSLIALGQVSNAVHTAEAGCADQGLLRHRPRRIRAVASARSAAIVARSTPSKAQRRWSPEIRFSYIIWRSRSGALACSTTQSGTAMRCSPFNRIFIVPISSGLTCASRRWKAITSHRWRICSRAAYPIFTVRRWFALP